MTSPFAFRLKAARLQLGVTQEEVAVAVGVSKQAISQYEKGRKRPDSTTLISLARYFQKPASFFLKPVETSLEHVEFRKRASLRGKQLASVRMSILERLEPYLELERLLGAEQSFQNPLKGVTITHPEDAEACALTVLSAWNLGLNPIPNVAEMLEENGVKVVEVPIDAGFDGLSSMVDATIPVIVINSRQDLFRKRFTALHELGHLIMEFGESTSPRDREAACNRFAGAMLLPASVMYAAIGARRAEISLAELIPIKVYHGISLAAIVYRGRDLGIFSPALTARFWMRRAKEEELKQEKPDRFGEYKGEERVFRFDQLLARAVSEQVISLSKAAGLSGKTLEEVKTFYQLI